jgi:mannose-6-phosphate isomerase-like protein (cupin superfamily)
MFILSGEFECWDFDPETDALREKIVCGQGTSIYIPSLAPHGMKNIGNEAGTFRCCIGNVYEE